MKAVKALKRLTKIEVMLSDVINRYAADKHGVLKSLRDAKACVVRAKEAVQAAPQPTKNPSVKTTAIVKVAAPAKSMRPALAKKVAPKTTTAVKKSTTKKPKKVVMKTEKAGMPSGAKKTAPENAAAKKPVATEQAVKQSEQAVAAKVAAQ